ncbi:MAG: hypothetical protein CMJ19_12065 [Phycisphaeraceae bacterium]|nr:hypothetical protein [Phycisphaeraceae bacterium]
MTQPTACLPHPDWCHWYQHLLAYMPRGVHWYHPLPPYYTGYEQGTLYDWDQYFEAILQIYTGYPNDYARNAVDIFLGTQEDDGFIARSASPGQWAGFNFQHRDMVKPFLAQILLLIYHQDGVINWLKDHERYSKMVRYLKCWITRFDISKQGLSVWRHAQHTGMDNHYERAGRIDKAKRNEPLYCEGVDLNAYLVRELLAMSQLAQILEYPDDAAEFAQLARQRIEAMRLYLWDESEQIFYDRDARTGELIRVKHVGIFASMWAGVATEDQASHMVNDHLLNEDEFWRPWPIPALAASEPTYTEGFIPGENTNCCTWRGNTWVPTNYYTFQGLKRYGYDDVAKELAAKTLTLFDRGKFCEYYTSESGTGTGRKPFWGWTALAMFMPIEHSLQIDPTLINATNTAGSAMRQWIKHQQ